MKGPYKSSVVTLAETRLYDKLLNKFQNFGFNLNLEKEEIFCSINVA